MDDSQTQVADAEAVETEAVADESGQVADAGTPNGDKPVGEKAGETDAPDGDADQSAAPDWRVEAAGEDKDLLKLAKRYGSQRGVLRALADAKAQISKGTSGVLNLPDDATDEQKAEFCKARDIPATPDAYDMTIKGVEWTDADKAVLGEFAQVAHGKNLSNAQTKEIIQWYADSQIAANQDREVKAAAFQKETLAALQAEYGSDYKRNVSLMQGFGVAQLGAEGWESFVGQRLEDGTRIGDNPAFVRLIVDSALERGDGLPFESGNGAGGMSDADLMAAHKKLVQAANAPGRNKEALDARSKLADPDYERKITAAYERQEKRNDGKRSAG